MTPGELNIQHKYFLFILSCTDNAQFSPMSQNTFEIYSEWFKLKLARINSIKPKKLNYVLEKFKIIDRYDGSWSYFTTMYYRMTMYYQMIFYSLHTALAKFPNLYCFSVFRVHFNRHVRRLKWKLHKW